VYKKVREYYCDFCNSKMENYIKIQGRNKYTTLQINGFLTEKDIEIDDKEFCSYMCLKGWISKQIDEAEKHDIVSD